MPVMDVQRSVEVSASKMLTALLAFWIQDVGNFDAMMSRESVLTNLFWARSVQGIPIA